MLSDGANCTVLRAVVLIRYRRVTDGQTDRRTDRIAVARTALAMRRAVKTLNVIWNNSFRKILTVVGESALLIYSF